MRLKRVRRVTKQLETTADCVKHFTGHDNDDDDDYDDDEAGYRNIPLLTIYKLNRMFEREVLTAAIMNSPIFWHRTPVSSLKANQYFGRMCCFHLQGRRMSY
jgi:hypothetical protein